jgi:hypothetical protein
MDKYEKLLILVVCIASISFGLMGFGAGYDAGVLRICNEMHWKSEACVAEWSRRVSDAGIENFEGEVK